MNCIKKVFSTIANFFRACSFGKLQLGLYHNGKLTYSSICGGITSLILVALMIVITIFISVLFTDGYERKNLTTDYKGVMEAYYQGNLN